MIENRSAEGIMYGDGWRWVREDGTFLYSKDRIWWSTEPSPVQRSMDQWVGALHGEEVETVEEMPQRGTLPQRSAPDILAAAADTFRERNVTYGNNYKEFGKMFSALFPHGLSLPPNDYAAYNRLGLLVMCAVRDGRSERVNFGAAVVAITLIAYYFSEVFDKLGRSASLIGLGVLFLLGVWLLERLRRGLVERIRLAAPSQPLSPP